MLGPTTRHRALSLAAGLIAAATIAACDTATQPTAPISAARTKPAAIEGDTLSCGTNGWVVIQGAYVCNPDPG